MLTIDQVAELLALPKGTIYAWRHRGIGPRGYRIGRHVRFRRDEVDAWIAQQRDPENTTTA